MGYGKREIWNVVNLEMECEICNIDNFKAGKLVNAKMENWKRKAVNEKCGIGY